MGKLTAMGCHFVWIPIAKRNTFFLNLIALLLPYRKLRKAFGKLIVRWNAKRRLKTWVHSKHVFRRPIVYVSSWFVRKRMKKAIQKVLRWLFCYFSCFNLIHTFFPKFSRFEYDIWAAFDEAISFSIVFS